MSALEDSQMSSSEDSEMSDSEDSEMNGYEDLEMSTPENFKLSTPEGVCPECYCGHQAKLRVSNTLKNPSRLFYNCPKRIDGQCGYFQWADELGLADDKHAKELNLIRFQCTKLQKRLEEAQQRHDNDRIGWQGRITELMNKLSTVQAELDEMKKKIEKVNDTELMPPLDKLSNSVAYNERDDAKVIYAI